MSQNKTKIQGLEPFDGKGSEMNFVREPQNFYSRNQKNTNKGTVIPGMMDMQVEDEVRTASSINVKKKNLQTGKPVVGFLYTISRTPLGEYWPLHIGRNTIGQGSNSDIVLPEGTVSSDHAILVLRQIKNTGGVIAAITDTQSTNGTMINGETIGFSAVECHNGDVITIGNNYELVLVLIDAAKLNLTVSQDFLPVEIEEDAADDIDIPNFGNGATRPGGFDPYADAPSRWDDTSCYTPSDGTVGMDGSKSGDPHGGTVPM